MLSGIRDLGELGIEFSLGSMFKSWLPGTSFLFKYLAAYFRFGFNAFFDKSKDKFISFSGLFISGVVDCLRYVFLSDSFLQLLVLRLNILALTLLPPGLYGVADPTF